MSAIVLDAFAAEFRRYRTLSEEAAAQLSWDQCRAPLDAETNSVAVLMKHVGGNLRSRWTAALTTDGEKPWRDRDREFVDDFPDQAAMIETWSNGWEALEASLTLFAGQSLERTLSIRGVPHTLAHALARSLAHTAYHTGQIVQVSRVLASRAGQPWRTLTVPRGGSDVYNKQMGFHAGASPRQ